LIHHINSNKRHWSIVATTVGITVFVVIIVILHFIQPDYNPKYQLISELAIGKYGGLVFIAFLGLAAAVFGLQVAISESGATRSYRVLLNIDAMFFFLTGIFPLGRSPTIHIISITIAFILSVLSMYLFPSSAGRASNAVPCVVSWSLAVGIALSVALGNYIIPIGISQRLAAFCLILWLSLITWNLFKLEKY
jgi:hypothetical protein